MSKQFFIESLVVCAVLAVLLSSSMVITSWKDALGDIPIFIFFSVLPILLMVYCITVPWVLWYKAWASIQDGNARTTPGKAVGYILIPIYNLYWIFQVYWGFAKDYNNYIERHRYDTEKLPEGLFLAIPIMLVIGGIIPVIIHCLEMPYPIAVIIRFLDISYYITGFIVSVMVLAKVCDAVNAISTPPDIEQVEEQNRVRGQ